MRVPLATVALIVLFSCTPASPVDTSHTKPSALPGSAVNAHTYVVTPRVPVGVDPRAIFTNTGTVTVEYGNPYTVERWFRGDWKTVDQPSDPEIVCAFTLEAYSIEPGGSKSQAINVCDRQGERRRLVPGRYRVTKTVRTEGSGGDSSQEVITLRATFLVTRPCGSSSMPSGAHVSERAAIEAAFGPRRVADCSRFEAYLNDTGRGHPEWTVDLYRPGSRDCSDFTHVDAISGKVGPDGIACP